MEGHWWGGGREIMGKEVQEIGSMNDRYKIDRGRSRIGWEMEKPKHFYV